MIPARRSPVRPSRTSTRSGCTSTCPQDRNVLGFEPSDHQPYLYGLGVCADLWTAGTAVFHYSYEQGFSAATQLDVTRPRLFCLSNNADIAADQTTAALLRDCVSTPTRTARTLNR